MDLTTQEITIKKYKKIFSSPLLSSPVEGKINNEISLKNDAQKYLLNGIYFQNKVL